MPTHGYSPSRSPRLARPMRSSRGKPIPRARHQAGRCVLHGQQTTAGGDLQEPRRQHLFPGCVRNHFLKSKQPSATTIFGADTEMAAVVTGPEAPAEGGLSNHIMGGQMGQSRGGSDMSARPKGGFVFAPPRLSTQAQFSTKRWRLTARRCMRSPRSWMPRFTGGHIRPGWDCIQPLSQATTF